MNFAAARQMMEEEKKEHVIGVQTGDAHTLPPPPFSPTGEPRMPLFLPRGASCDSSSVTGGPPPPIRGPVGKPGVPWQDATHSVLSACSGEKLLLISNAG